MPGEKRLVAWLQVRVNDKAWEKVIAVYEQLPGWIGFSNGIPFWFGTNENEKHISASVEPSGLLVGAYMAAEEWLQWVETFQEIATRELGFPVKNAEN
ncbi:hypothetical protein ICL55_23490 [Chitinophaga varians]|nr:hypothetical protein [Chitinophaga varians]